VFSKGEIKRRVEGGVAAVEFALIAWILILLLIGIMEISRILFVWNSANEAVRYGARVAVVCQENSRGVILKRMQTFLPALTDNDVKLDVGSATDYPRFVTVAIKESFTFKSVFPLFVNEIRVPTAQTSISAEAGLSASNPSEPYSRLCDPAF